MTNGVCHHGNWRQKRTNLGNSLMPVPLPTTINLETIFYLWICGVLAVFSPLENDVHFGLVTRFCAWFLYGAPMWWTCYGLQKQFRVKLPLQPLTTNINRLYYFMTCPQPIALAPLLHRDGRSTMVTFVTEIFLSWFLCVSMESWLDGQSHRNPQFCPSLASTMTELV
jgi:hypothetical protein